MKGVLTFAHISLVSIFGENVAKRLRAQLFSAMVRQDMSFFDSHRSGELVGRLTTDVADFKVLTGKCCLLKQTLNVLFIAHIQTIGDTRLEVCHTDSWICHPFVPHFDSFDADNAGYYASIVCFAQYLWCLFEKT